MKLPFDPKCDPVENRPVYKRVDLQVRRPYEPARIPYMDVFTGKVKVNLKNYTFDYYTAEYIRNDVLSQPAPTPKPIYGNHDDMDYGFCGAIDRHAARYAEHRRVMHEIAMQAMRTRFIEANPAQELRTWTVD